MKLQVHVRKIIPTCYYRNKAEEDKVVEILQTRACRGQFLISEYTCEVSGPVLYWA